MVFAIEWTKRRPAAAELLGATGVNVFLAITTPLFGQILSPEWFRLPEPRRIRCGDTFVYKTRREPNPLVAVHTPMHASGGGLAALCLTLAPVALSMMVLVASESQARHSSLSSV